MPPSCGGAGASLAQLQQVIAAIARGEPATALIVCMQYLHHLRLAENDARHAPLRQQVFHDAVEHGGLINSLRVEPELGSPARGGLPDTVATRRAEGWDISGHKIYTTGIEGLRWLAVWEAMMITRRWWALAGARRQPGHQRGEKLGSRRDAGHRQP